MAAGGLRFAVIFDQPASPGDIVVPRWVALCLDELQRSGAATLDLVILLPVPPREVLPFGLFSRAYRHLFAGRRSPAMQLINISGIIDKIPTLSAALSPADERAADSAVLAGAAVEAIAAQSLDFILHVGTVRLTGRICAASRLGLWTFTHLEDERRGLSPGFREVARGEAVSVCALQRLDAAGEAPVELRRGVFQTMASWPRNADALRLGSAPWCALVCREIAVLGRHRASLSAPQPLRRAEALSDAALAAYLRRRLYGLARKIWRSLFFIETWNVALIETPVETVARSGRAEPATWLPAPASLRFIADPFVLCRDGRRHLFAEEFDYGAAKGWISRTDLTGDGRHDAIPLFVRPSHMSYPFLFENDGRIFCVPETGEDSRVLLFEATRFPDQWREPVVLIDGFKALDSTVFKHDGRWWLLCTDAAAGAERELHAWYSDALTGPFLPHPLNPLTCDVRSARPAGAPFHLDGVLHRPAQDCSLSYGGALTINRIDVLDPADFSETPVQRLSPDPHGPYPDGLHTLSGAGDVTVIDGKRFAFHPLALALRFNVKLQAKRRRAALARQPAGQRGNDISFARQPRAIKR